MHDLAKHSLSPAVDYTNMENMIHSALYQIFIKNRPGIARLKHMQIENAVERVFDWIRVH